LIEGGQLFQIGVHGSRGGASDDQIARDAGRTCIPAGVVVEISPPLDDADLTVHLGAYLLWEMLALAALDRVLE
jgi:arginase family enzyme